ncbi:hypothetical protein EJP82_13445 [Paenibacillus anaericanus]|uniref:Uncharacterized protein n=1 Tax=Paenibacillus anaericanus TaxID=170367 RepID=A0A3S1K887_9BACL|nr:hypothetical protein [Paenibacillus anaericanus]RUT46122.1 hypothetical protein EJP82_13445 [Paenibacillus anaericanus]
METYEKWNPFQKPKSLGLQNSVVETIQSIEELEMACTRLSSYIHRIVAQLLQESSEMLNTTGQGINKHRVTGVDEFVQPVKNISVEKDDHLMEFSTHMPENFIPVLQPLRTRKLSKEKIRTSMPFIQTSPNLRLNK